MATNGTLTALNGGKKIVLGLIGLSLCAILVASFAYRTSHPNLTEPGRQPAAQSMPSGGDNGADELTHLMALMKEDPNNVGVLKQLTDFFIRQQDWNRAGFFVQKAQVVAPSDPQVLYMQGIILFNEQKPAEAVEVFESLIALEDDASARYNLGIIYKHFLKQPEKAKPHFEALLANPKADAELKKRAQSELDTEHK
ncbi:MAG: tetratricopeptide repeat protein [Halodesulfovibrio sp.]